MMTYTADYEESDYRAAADEEQRAERARDARDLAETCSGDSPALLAFIEGTDDAAAFWARITARTAGPTVAFCDATPVIVPARKKVA
jgi:hypothetical protein